MFGVGALVDRVIRFFVNCRRSAYSLTLSWLQVYKAAKLEDGGN